MRTSVCIHCQQPIVRMRYAGWVETRSGDQGGNYDLCPDNPLMSPDDLESGSHQPRKGD